MNEFELSLNNVLVETFNYILKYEERSLRNFLNVPVTITEAHLIEAVGKQNEQKATVSVLADVLNISMPTATVAVKRLEGKGLLQKAPCLKDARRTIISLTEMGKRVERAHRLFHEKMVKNLSRQFEDTEKEALLKAINSLREFFKVRVEV